MATEAKLPEGYGSEVEVYAKKKTRRKAAKTLKKASSAGGYLAFVKKWMKANPGKSIKEAAAAWKAQNKS